MENSITNIIKRLEELEQLLANDFQMIALSLKNCELKTANNAIGYRIVEQLQCHDIIRQKMEHVRHFLYETTNSYDSLEAKPDPMFIELALALLNYTHIEYKEVTESFHSLNVRELNAPHNLKTEFDIEIFHFIKNLEKMYLLADSAISGSKSEELDEKIRKIRESFSMKSERDIFSMLYDEALISSNLKDKENPEGDIELFI